MAFRSLEIVICVFLSAARVGAGGAGVKASAAVLTPDEAAPKPTEFRPLPSAQVPRNIALVRQETHGTFSRQLANDIQVAIRQANATGKAVANAARTETTPHLYRHAASAAELGSLKPDDDSSGDGATTKEGTEEKGSSSGGVGMGLVLGIILVLGVLGLVCFFFRNTIQMYLSFAQMGEAASQGDVRGVTRHGAAAAKSAAKAAVPGVAWKVGEAAARPAAEAAAKAVPKGIPQHYQAQAGGAVLTAASQGQAVAKSAALGYGAASGASSNAALQASAGYEAATGAASNATVQASAGYSAAAAQASQVKLPTPPKMPPTPTALGSAPTFRGPG